MGTNYLMKKTNMKSGSSPFECPTRQFNDIYFKIYDDSPPTDSVPKFLRGL